MFNNYYSYYNWKWLQTEETEDLIICSINQGTTSKCYAGKRDKKTLHLFE